MNILVVDDQPLNRHLLQTMLEQQSYSVYLATNGQEALAILYQEDIDIVLLDVMMPIMDGFEAAPKIKEYANDVYLPIIFITALEDQSSFEKCLAVGGDDFIHKPFDRVILSAKIKAHARTRKLSQQTHSQRKQLEYHYNQIEREHEIVEHIFSNALMQGKEFDKLCDFHLSPASMFNGDMFLMAKSPMGGFYCLLGDFTGHGLAAAVGALPASRIFYTMVQKGMSVSDIAAELNASLVNLLPGHMFCAAAIIELSSSGRRLSAWLGGLPDLYLIDQSGDVVKTLESQHMALGILNEDEFERNLIFLEVEESQRLVMATDGIIETENPKGEMFGDEAFKAVLKNSDYVSTSQVISEVRHYAGGSAQQDDLSIAILNCISSELEHEVSTTYSNLPFQMSIEISAEKMKSTDPVLELVDVLSEIEGVSAHRSNIFLLLSEVYNNALDHGVLGLDSEIKNKEDGFLEFYLSREAALRDLNNASIHIAVIYDPDALKLHFIVEDSGCGFDVEAKRNSEHEDEHGRGVELLKELTQSIDYNSLGNEVHLTYSLK